VLDSPFDAGAKIGNTQSLRRRAMSGLEPIPCSDAQLRAILQRVRTIAMVGASPNWSRPSYFVMKYLQNKRYRVIPVNPGIAGDTLLGETAYASLHDIPDRVDTVDVFLLRSCSPHRA
jgi:O-acetylhomoserine (thiol)-lyase